MRLPPLNALRVFEVAARRQSFTAAADELHVSLGAVSRHIAHLEAVLGGKLFERRHRAVSLTAMGEDYAATIRPALAEVERATLRASAAARAKKVRVRAFHNFVHRWLTPRAPIFRQQFPDIVVQFLAAEEAPLLDGEPIDLSVHIHLPFSSGLDYEPLFPLAIIPVCSPSTAERLGRVTGPADLKKGTLLCSSVRRDDWSRWFAAAGCSSPDRRTVEVLNSSQAYDAAVAGTGIAVIQREHAQEDLACGRLVSPWPFALETGELYYIAARKLVPKHVAAFRDWMVASTH